MPETGRTGKPCHALPRKIAETGNGFAETIPRGLPRRMAMAASARGLGPGGVGNARGAGTVSATAGPWTCLPRVAGWTARRVSGDREGAKESGPDDGQCTAGPASDMCEAHAVSPGEAPARGGSKPSAFSANGCLLTTDCRTRHPVPRSGDVGWSKVAFRGL